MRKIRSLIEDDDALGGGLSFLVIGVPSAICGLIEGQILNCVSLFLPALSSMTGGSLGSLWGIAHTWIANCITA